MSSEAAIDHSRRALRIGVTISTLLFSGTIATPSFANYFHNPHLNLNRNIGSAPSPTPQDIRENRLPTLVHPAPQHAVAENPDRSGRSNQSRGYDRRGRNSSIGQLPGKFLASLMQAMQGVAN